MTPAWAIAIAIMGTALAFFTIGWRMGSNGQWDAGYRMARSESDQCP